MSNILNKIHYLCKITTTNSTKTSPSIGLYEGVFRFATDGYDPFASGATYEQEYTDITDMVNVEDNWNTDLMATNGISNIGSKIDIVAGGDYAFLQNASVKLVNKTNLGHSIHKTIDDLSDVSVIGATMEIFVSIDNILYQKWSGIVSAKAFSDMTYTFTGADKLSNNTDTINNVILGIINVDTTYKTIDTLVAENLVAQEFGVIEGTHIMSNFERVGDDGVGVIVNTDEYTGVGAYTNGLYKIDNEVAITFNDNNSSIANSIEIGDFLRYIVGSIDDTSDTSGEIYKISNIQSDTSGPDSKFWTTTINVGVYDRTANSFSFLFNPDSIEFYGTVKDSLDTIGNTDTKCYFSLYKSVIDTGILASTISGTDGIIEVIDENGVVYRLQYTTTPEGYIKINEPVATSIVKPLSTQYFTSDVPLFDDVTGRDWDNFSDALSSASTISLTNDMNKDSAFVEFNKEMYHYFYLEFDEDVIDSNVDYNLGSMIKGVFDEEPQAWVNNGDPAEVTINSPFNATLDYNGLIDNRPDWDNYSPAVDTYRIYYNTSYAKFTIMHNRRTTGGGIFTDIFVSDDITPYGSYTGITGSPYDGQTTSVTLEVQPKGTQNPEWNRYVENEYYPDGTQPTYPVTSNYDSAFLMLPTLARKFEITYFKMIEHNGYGDIPVYDSVFKLPNVLDNNNTVSKDSDNPTYSFIGSSIPSTNLPKYDEGVISTYDPEYLFTRQPTVTLDPFVGKTLYPASQEDDKPLDVTTSNTKILVQVTGGDEDKTEHIQMINRSWEYSEVNTSLIDEIVFKLNGFCLFTTLPFNSAEIDITYRSSSTITNNSYVDIVKDLTNYNGDYSKIDASRYTWGAGLLVSSQQQRYTVVTKLMKQGFCTGATSRFGFDTYKTFPEVQDDATILTINNDITIDKSIKNFKSTSISKVYNEFEIKGDFETVAITGITEIGEFPLETENWTNYVSGIDNYQQAKGYWNKAYNAYSITGAIHKAPADRTILEFTSYELIQDMFSTIGTDYVSSTIVGPILDIVPGRLLRLYFNEYRITFNEGDILNLYDGAIDLHIRCYIHSIDQDFIWVTVNETNWVTGDDLYPSFYQIECYRETTNQNNTYRDEYIDLLLDWTTYPKLQTKFAVPVTTDTIKWGLMDNVQFSDPIITPDLGEYGAGWLTSVNLDPKKSVINCEITFEPEFYMIPSAFECGFIIEDVINTDYIIEDETNVDYINERAC